MEALILTFIDISSRQWFSLITLIQCQINGMLYSPNGKYQLSTIELTPSPNVHFPGSGCATTQRLAPKFVHL